MMDRNRLDGLDVSEGEKGMPLQKPPRNPETTNRMVRKAREIYQAERTRRWIGLVAIILIAVIVACVARHFLSGTAQISVTP